MNLQWKTTLTSHSEGPGAIFLSQITADPGSWEGARDEGATRQQPLPKWLVQFPEAGPQSPGSSWVRGSLTPSGKVGLYLLVSCDVFTLAQKGHSREAFRAHLGGSQPHWSRECQMSASACCWALCKQEAQPPNHATLIQGLSLTTGRAGSKLMSLLKKQQ